MSSPIFDEVQLDPKISYGCKGGPSYRTTVLQTKSGFDQTIPEWALPKRSWTISEVTKNATIFRYLLNFFMARQGRARGFRFKDWSDYKTAGDTLINTGTTSLQLQITYQDPVNAIVRKIKKPVANTVILQKNGVTLNLGTDYTLDATTGLVTLTTAASGAVFTWAGQYDTPVRFDTDDMQYTISDFQIFDWSDIPIIELFLP